MRLRAVVSSILLLLSLAVPPLNARVLRVEIASRVDVLGGKQFGDAGAYERITGRVFFSLPIANPHNQRIVDLSNAVNLKNGEVEFSSDFIAVRPKDAHKGNGSMLLEVPNRGHARILSLVDGGDSGSRRTTPATPGCCATASPIVSLGLAMGRGWPRRPAPLCAHRERKRQDDHRPPSRRPDASRKRCPRFPWGTSLLGRNWRKRISRCRSQRSAQRAHGPRSREAERTVIPRAEWQFAHTVDGKLTPSDRHIHLNGGFQPGKIYEYVYVVADPVVAGGGFAAIRDFASYAKHAPDAVTPAARVYGEGISQNGRFLRDFLYQGFNADEEGRIALDGVLAHVAGAGRGSFNYRFAQPSRDAQPTSSVFFPTDIFPFTDQPENDPLTGETAGLLDRATAEKVVPKIFFSNTSYEYWGRAGALIHVTRRRQTRCAHLRQRPHLSLHRAAALFRPVPSGKRQRRPARPAAAVAASGQIFLARHDRQHGCMGAHATLFRPPAAIPRLPTEHWCRCRDYALPAIPGVNRPHEANTAYRTRFRTELAGRHSHHPTAEGRSSLSPCSCPRSTPTATNATAFACRRSAFRSATYASWNLRDPSIGAPDQRVAFETSYIPFPKTAADRQKTGDPRKSIAERYSGS